MAQNNREQAITRRVVKGFEYKNIELDWLPFDKWPNNLKDGIIKGTLGNVERWNLFIFMVGNGMKPEEAAHWIKWFMRNKYKANQLEYEFKRLCSFNYLKEIHKYKYYDVLDDCYKYVHIPDMAERMFY